MSAFTVESSGKLTPINQQPSKGAGPCHIVLDNYGQAPDCRELHIGQRGRAFPSPPMGDSRRPPPRSSTPARASTRTRQSGPHAHCVTLDRANRFAFVCDLGLDKIMSYRFDADYRQADAPTTRRSPPSNPAPARGICHSGPTSSFAYAINELSSTVTVFSYDSAAGKLTEIQNRLQPSRVLRRSELRRRNRGPPSGKWVYASNRGNNTVILFNVDSGKGTLTYVEEQGTGGKTPRHFGIEPSAKHLAIANQDTDQLLACRIDPGNGRLKPSGIFAECPSPTCVKFLPPA